MNGAADAGLDLRVARVADVRDHPNADRLLVMEVDLGDERRQIVAGLVGHYEPEALRDRSIVVVANLEPARLRGEISEGMLLAVEQDDRLGILLAPDAEPGARLATQSSPPPTGQVSFEEFQAHELVVEADGVKLDGERLQGADLHVDRGLRGRLR